MKSWKNLKEEKWKINKSLTRMIKYVTTVQGVKSSWNNVIKYSSLSRKSNKLNGTYSVKGVIILKENKILGEAWPLVRQQE